MKIPASPRFTLAAVLLGLGTGVGAQERSPGLAALEPTCGAVVASRWGPGARVTPHADAYRYRGTYGRARATRGHGFPPRRVLAPGHFQRVTYQVFVQARSEKVWVPPAYVTRYDFCGRPYQVLVREGHFRTIRRPAHYETRTGKKWIPGNDVTACGPASHRVALFRQG